MRALSLYCHVSTSSSSFMAWRRTTLVLHPWDGFKNQCSEKHRWPCRVNSWVDSSDKDLHSINEAERTLLKVFLASFQPIKITCHFNVHFALYGFFLFVFFTAKPETTTNTDSFHFLPNDQTAAWSVLPLLILNAKRWFQAEKMWLHWPLNPAGLKGQEVG